MERALRLLPRHQILYDVAQQMPEGESPSVETYLHFLGVASDILAAQQAFYDRFDLSEGKLVILLLLRQEPGAGMTPSQLAEAAGVTRGTITGLLAGLERSELITRLEHPEDGRMVTIELTQQALLLFEQILPERIRRICAFMTALTEKEQQQLLGLLEKMALHLPALHEV
jgi:DNA-binding MarR family transcriptional regulator